MFYDHTYYSGDNWRDWEWHSFVSIMAYGSYGWKDKK